MSFNGINRYFLDITTFLFLTFLLQKEILEGLTCTSMLFFINDHSMTLFSVICIAQLSPTTGVYIQFRKGCGNTLFFYQDFW